MKQYELITKYIFILRDNPLETVFTHTDSNEGFLQEEYNKYSPVVDQFMGDCLEFVESHPELGLQQYSQIIDSYETDPAYIRRPDETMNKEYLDRLDARGVLAWIVSAVRAEQFRPGALYDSIRKGYINTWLLKLNELDD